MEVVSTSGRMLRRYAYAELAASVDRSLADSLTRSAELAGESIKPHLAEAMAGISAPYFANVPQEMHFDTDTGFFADLLGIDDCLPLASVERNAVREGAEDDGEMGAYHHLYHSAQLRAVKSKLRDFLPLGQEIAIRYDPRLARPAASGPSRNA